MKMKNIVLCSDGTGNKGGYGEDTNVYKTYKAVNVFDVDQYTFYDQGVGTDKSDTNKNKYWTALAGAFGFGFRDNVLNLYHFLARSYEPGDTIYLFGFSRGAATVRAFAGFINACGLVDKKHAEINGTFEGDLFHKLVKQAFDAYRSKDKNVQQKFKNKYALQDKDYAPNGDINIKFIGVWDTVSALGFPKDFSSILQGIGTAAEKIANMIPCLAHDFYDYELNDSIENAYHALSIDDERQTFHPLVWDETNFKGYVEQVWFAGVHSNVGGGYPRTGLSDVALLWMLTKAQTHGLQLHSGYLSAIQDGANIYDKLYDSRDGIALYYRYGPRNLAELCKNKKNQQSKLKGTIAIHITAYNKIKELSDGYAPDGIPPYFEVVDGINPSKPFYVDAVENQQKPENKGKPAWATLEVDMNKIIGERKILYRVFVELTMAIILVSGYFWINQPKSVAELNACEINRIQIIQENAQGTDKNLTIKSIPFLAYEQNAGDLPLDTPPDFCIAANNRPLKWLADIMQYLTPAYFENFITYVVEVHTSILIGMLLILLFLSQLRKSFINKLDKVCRQMSDLLL
jgi:uncharacterized protein (DUF2235 family)